LALSHSFICFSVSVCSSAVLSLSTRRSSDLGLDVAAVSEADLGILDPANRAASFAPIQEAALDPAERNADRFALGSNAWTVAPRSEEHTSELQSRENLVCRLLLEKKHTTEST